MIPAKSPQVKLAAGLVKIPDGAPIATPPAKLAFNMSSMSNFYLKYPDVMKAPKQLPVRAMIVFMMMIDLYCP